MNRILLVLSLCLLSTCEPAYAASKKQPVAVPSPVASFEPDSDFQCECIPTGLGVDLPCGCPTTASPNQGPSFEPDNYYTTVKERAKIKAASLKAAEVIHSKCFADFVMSRPLIQTGGRTREEVISHLASLFGSTTVQMYSTLLPSKAVAYRRPPSNVIHLHRSAFYPSLPTCQWAATLGHEGYGHAFGGYDHDFKWNKNRSFSVPYTIGGADRATGGDAFAKCCNE